MKKIVYSILLIVSLSMVFGCRTDDSVKTDRATFQNGFNDQAYVWESFLFPTNRVMDRK